MTSPTNEKRASGHVEFLEYHHPALPLGNYTLKVEQTIESHQDGVAIKQGELSAQRQFSVLGPRFSLDPQLIHAVFPPAGSLGEHSHVLPHIAFNRSTLPWERTAVHGQKDVPWLALLLFAEGEKLGGTIAPNDFFQKYNQVKTAVDPPGMTLWHVLQEIGWLKVGTSRGSVNARIMSSDRERLNDKIKDEHLKDKIEAILDQFRTPKPISLKQLMINEQDLVEFPKLLARDASEDNQPKLEYGDHPDDLVTIIDVPKDLLQQIMPTKEELRWLSHVRRSRDAAGKPGGEEFAVIIGNRLPKAGELSTVHLVSIEGRFDQGGFICQDTANDTLIRLISLKSWRFACVSEKQSFKGLLLHLNHPLLFSMPSDTTSQSNSTIGDALNTKEIPAQLRQAFVESGHGLSENSVVLEQKNGTENGHWLLEDKENISRRYLLSQEGRTLYVYALDPEASGTLRLPKPESKITAANEAAEGYLAMGSVPLPHALRQGNQTVSWYHGPLVPGPNKTKDIDLPIRTADELTRYNENLGMFDVSYSAAWELGRLLTLKNKRVAVDLFNWKRAHTHHQILREAEEELIDLPFDGPSPTLHLPQSVIAWFEHLALLQGVPFNYLVPDERLLPQESIRFFHVDRLWIECLLDGAFSIGRVLRNDLMHDKEQNETVQTAPQRGPVTGFLLRSDVVAGWPGLQVDGYDALDQDAADDPKLTMTDTRLEQLLNDKQISELQQMLAGAIMLSANCTIDNRSWSITSPDGSPTYELCQAENNEIDVLRDQKFLFSIDASFENELNERQISEALERIFQQKNNPMLPGSQVSPFSWFISDQENQMHYRVCLENGVFKIYRQYILPLLRMERLSKNVLICLFEGLVQVADIHLRPETIHFGVNRPDDVHDNGYYKILRNNIGQEDMDFCVSVPFKNQAKESNVVAIAELVNQLNELSQDKANEKKLAWGDPNDKQNPPTPAHFALQMIEGVQKVRFINSSQPADRGSRANNRGGSTLRHDG